MKSSWGSVTSHSCSTVRPPTPESKTPIGRVSMGRSLGAKMDDRYLRDVQGARHGLAPVGSDLRSRRSRPGENRVSQVQVGTTCTGHERSAITQIANGGERQYGFFCSDTANTERTVRS